MLRVLHIATFVLTTSILSAQINNSISRFWLKDTSAYQISTSNKGSLNSNTLNNHVLYPGLKSGMLNQADLKQSFDKAPSVFLMGYDVYNALSLAWRKNNTSYFISINNRMHGHASTDQGVAKLFFLGNKHLEGDTLVSPLYSGFTNMNYQQLQLGFLTHLEESDIQLGCSVSLINASQIYNLELGTLSLYTDSFGRYIDAKLRAMESQSNPQKKGFFTSNGLGFSSDFYLNLNLPLFSHWDSSLARLNIEINDLGVMWWNRKSHHQFTDTILTHYQGVDLEKYITDSTYSESLNLFQNTWNSKFHSFLPVFVTISLQKDIHKHRICLGINHRPNADFVPYLYLKDRWSINKYFSLVYGLNHGGYGKFGAQLGFMCNIAGFKIELVDQQVEGQIFQTYSMGNGFVFNLSKTF